MSWVAMSESDSIKLVTRLTKPVRNSNKAMMQTLLKMHTKRGLPKTPSTNTISNRVIL